MHDQTYSITKPPTTDKPNVRPATIGPIAPDDLAARLARCYAPALERIAKRYAEHERREAQDGGAK